MKSEAKNIQQEGYHLDLNDPRNQYLIEKILELKAK